MLRLSFWAGLNTTQRLHNGLLAPFVVKCHAWLILWNVWGGFERHRRKVSCKTWFSEKLSHPKNILPQCAFLNLTYAHAQVISVWRLTRSSAWLVLERETIGLIVSAVFHLMVLVQKFHKAEGWIPYFHGHTRSFDYKCIPCFGLVWVSNLV